MSADGPKRKLENEGFTIIEWGNYFTKDELGDIPYEPGVYILYWGETMQYVGKSNNLQIRLSEWERRDYYKEYYIPFGSIAWFVLPENQISDAEAILIDYYDPPYNQQYPSLD